MTVEQAYATASIANVLILSLGFFLGRRSAKRK